MSGITRTTTIWAWCCSRPNRCISGKRRKYWRNGKSLSMPPMPLILSASRRVRRQGSCPKLCGSMRPLCRWNPSQRPSWLNQRVPQKVSVCYIKILSPFCLKVIDTFRYHSNSGKGDIAYPTKYASSPITGLPSRNGGGGKMSGNGKVGYGKQSAQRFLRLVVFGSKL